MQNYYSNRLNRRRTIMKFIIANLVQQFQQYIYFYFQKKDESEQKVINQAISPATGKQLIRGLFQREFKDPEQAQIQEIKAQQYRQELLQQMDDKKRIKDALKKQDDMEDFMYMERLRKQQEDLNVSGTDDNRKISRLRTKRQQQDSESQPQQVMPFRPTAYIPQYFQPPQIKQDHQIVAGVYEQSVYGQEFAQHNQYNYAQNRVDLDVMKQYYSYQQTLFERDLNQLRDQLIKGDLGRIAAEKELLYLQERAKEKQIWNILDYQSDAFMPNLAAESRNIFKTAKYGIGNMSEAERRQRILQDYYKQDKNAVALGNLYNNDNNGYAGAAPELETETELVMARGKQTQQDQQFDAELQNEIQILKEHRGKFKDYQRQEYDQQIRDPQAYQQMLEDKSLVSMMQIMKMKGDKKVMTPEDKQTGQLLDDQSGIRKQFSAGHEVQVNFLEEQAVNNKKIENTNEVSNGEGEKSEENADEELEQQQQLEQEIIASHQSSDYELVDKNQKTEEILDDEEEQYDEAPPKLLFDWELQQRLEGDSEIDPLDNRIDDMLGEIRNIVSNKKGHSDYYQIQNELRGNFSQQQQQSKEQLKSQEQQPKLGRQNMQHWKPINLFHQQGQRNQISEGEQEQRPVVVQQQQPQQWEVVQQKDHIESVDHIEQLDKLLKNFTQQKNI